MYRDILCFAAVCGVLAFAPIKNIFAAAPGPSALPEDSKSAVILSYSRIGEDYEPETSLRADQFAEHIREIATGGFHVSALPAIVEALQTGKTLPPHSLVITFDGGYRSILKTAVPLLLENKLPFTVFFSATQADDPSGIFLTWDDLKKLERNPLVTLGLHPASYERLEGQALQAQLNRAKLAYRTAFRKEPAFFAYPFGEYDAAYKTIIEHYGFTAALGLQSGPAYSGADLYALPRFPMTEKYGDLAHFKFIGNALPLPTRNTEPATPALSTVAPLIGFNTDRALQDSLNQLSCFVSGQDKPQIQILSDARIELRLARPVDQRTRINCTIPVRKDGNETRVSAARWLGFLLLPPKDAPNNPKRREPRSLPE